MAQGDGVLSDGTAIRLTNSAGVLTLVVGLKNLNTPNLMIEKVENTDHGSNKIKGYIPGQADVPELVFKIKYEAGGPTDALILEHQASRETRPFEIDEVAEDSSIVTSTGELFIMKYEPDDAPLGAIREATVTAQPKPLTRA